MGSAQEITKLLKGMERRKPNGIGAIDSTLFIEPAA